MASVYEIITNIIIDKLEKGVVPWHKPWTSNEMPKNLITKKEYRGINVFMLSLGMYKSPFWATFKQISELGGKVNKGEKGYPVVFWTWIDKKDDTSETALNGKIPLLRYYTVFNVEQTTGIDNKKIPQLIEKYSKIDSIKVCDNIVENMPLKPFIKFEMQKAFYNPIGDFVNMPKKELFDSSEEYYSTLFHELTHATGHKKRLARKNFEDHGKESYSKEELVAEMGASFLCGICQIENKTIDNSASYIKSWLGRLKNDKTFVVQAAAQAQKAVDFIIGKKVGEE